MASSLIALFVHQDYVFVVPAISYLSCFIFNCPFVDQDYVFVVPAISYNEKILGPLPVDKASEFIQFCAGDSFYIR